MSLELIDAADFEALYPNVAKRVHSRRYDMRRRMHLSNPKLCVNQLPRFLQPNL